VISSQSDTDRKTLYLGSNAFEVPSWAERCTTFPTPTRQSRSFRRIATLDITTLRKNTAFRTIPHIAKFYGGFRICACDSATLPARKAKSRVWARVASTIKEMPGPSNGGSSKHHLHIFSSLTTYSNRMSSRRESEFERLEQLLQEANERAEQ